MTMTAPTPKTNLAAKSALARLMAAENIAVEVDASAPTASFNVEERTLTLPLWDVEGDAYDMLVGHEVSHALYTPEGAASLEAACKSIDPKNYGVAKDYLNVVEDARIERLIKLDYPGLRRSFAAGYREFNARDLFGLKGKTVGDLTLIDRINVHYKIGWLIEVPFSEAELPLVQRVAETRTWDEVVALTKEIYEFAKAQNKKSEENKPQDGGEGQPAPKSDEDGEEQESDQDGIGTDEESEDGDEQSSSNGGDEEGDESGAEKSQGGKTEAEGENDEAEDGTEGGDESKDGEGKSQNSPTDEKGDEGEGGSATANGEGTVGNETNGLAPSSETVKALNDALAKMVKKSPRPIVYADLPEVAENMVIPFKRVEQALAAAAANIPTKDALVERIYAVWKEKNASDVLALATEFERRKAADAHRRTVTAETGSIDPTRLFAYKISDDIFLRSSTVQDGKNHGLVILLDMSGSMQGQMLDTVVQLVNLAAFARRVNIPFKVYGFVDYETKMADGKKTLWGVEKNAKAKWHSLTAHSVYLLTLLESGTTQQRFQKAAGGLLTWAASMGCSYAAANTKNPYHKAIFDSLTKTAQPSYGNNGYYHVYTKYEAQGFSLNGTPTNQALIALMSLVPQFKKEKNLQVVNTVILTDGDAGDRPLTDQTAYTGYGMGNNVRPLVVIRDPKTRREYKTWREIKNTGGIYYSEDGSQDQQRLLVSMLRDRTGSKVVNINLVTGSRAAAHVIARSVREAAQVTALKKSFTKNGWISIPNGLGFDEEIALNTSNAAETDFDFDAVTVDADTKAGQKELQKAFVKSLESRKGNRPLMARIAELISKNL